jgi:hypothetical protein
MGEPNDTGSDRLERRAAREEVEAEVEAEAAAEAGTEAFAVEETAEPKEVVGGEMVLLWLW